MGTRGGSQSLGQVTSSMCTGNESPSHPSHALNMLLSAYCDDRDKPLVRIIAATKTKKSDKVIFSLGINFGLRGPPNLSWPQIQNVKHCNVLLTFQLNSQQEFVLKLRKD